MMLEQQADFFVILVVTLVLGISLIGQSLHISVLDILCLGWLREAIRPFQISLNELLKTVCSLVHQELLKPSTNIQESRILQRWNLSNTCQKPSVRSLLKTNVLMNYSPFRGWDVLLVFKTRVSFVVISAIFTFSEVPGNCQTNCFNQVLKLENEKEMSLGHRMKKDPNVWWEPPGGVLGTNHHSAAIRPYILILFAENPERKKHAIVTSLSLDHFKKLQRLSLRFSPCGCDLMRQTLGKSWIKDCWGWLFHEHGAIPADMCSAHCYWTTIQAAVEGTEVSSETAAFCQQKLRFLRNVRQNCPSVSRAKLFFTETFGFKFHLSNGSIIHLFHVRAWTPVQW